MPLKKGSSKRTIFRNARESALAFKGSNKISTSRPKDLNKARAQALAIAFDKARKKR